MWVFACMVVEEAACNLYDGCIKLDYPWHCVSELFLSCCLQDLSLKRNLNIDLDLTERGIWCILGVLSFKILSLFYFFFLIHYIPATVSPSSSFSSPTPPPLSHRYSSPSFPLKNKITGYPGILTKHSLK